MLQASLWLFRVDADGFFLQSDFFNVWNALSFNERVAAPFCESWRFHADYDAGFLVIRVDVVCELPNEIFY